MVGTMDLSLFKKDIDELLDQFAQSGSTSFDGFKKVWLSRKFSYLYEGRSTTNSAVFMQGLYAHCIGYMTSAGSLSQRLGGLYCLYCLYETEPFKPFFKIYLSLGELKRLKELVIDARNDGIDIVAALIKRMIERDTFLFGFVDTVDGSISQRADEIRTLQNRLVQIAYEKLLANTHIEDYLHMDLGVELNLKGLKKMSSEYEKAKKLAIRGAGETVDTGDVQHIAESGDQVSERIEELVKNWDAQKEEFCKKTGIICGNEIVAAGEFDEELEHLLNDE
uniref:snRNA-activating protein complex subunit 1 n=1 Tax=Anthurium amnicola TaxID=1678845 RepID=A0A1D1YBE8_9ARAE